MSELSGDGAAEHEEVDNADLDAMAQNSGSSSRRTRKKRSFPNSSLEEALFLGNAIQKHGSGQPVRRLTLFETLQRAPTSGASRKLVTSSGQYGITLGSYQAEVLSLTPLGMDATDPTAAISKQTKARIDLGVLNVEAFKAIYDKYAGSRLPQISVLRDAAIESGVDEANAAECVETFLANCRFVGLIRSIAGTEHLVTVADVLDRLEDAPAETAGSLIEDSDANDPAAVAVRTRTPVVSDLSKPESSLDDVCFVISPIGSNDSEERKHANLVLGSLIEPAIEGLGLRAVRADGISKPGLITGQVLDHIARAKIVIADLSFGNPNVYYELALRQVLRKPLVQITRSSDKLPFDVGQFRTVVIDMTDIYTLLPALDLHRQEISRQCRAALDDGENAESPISRFFPSFWDYLP